MVHINNRACVSKPGELPTAFLAILGAHKGSSMTILATLSGLKHYMSVYLSISLSFIYLSVCHFCHLSVLLSVCRLSNYLYLSIFLSICLSVCLSIIFVIYPFVCLSVSVCHFCHLSVRLSVCCLSIYPSVCLSFLLFICSFVCLSFIYTILPKVLGRPLLMNRFDYFSNFHEYKS